MLVLSRRPGEQIVFPTLDITIHVLQTKGNTARIGIEAPPEVRVRRAELEPEKAADGARRPGQRSAHTLANLLNKLSLGLHLFRRQRQAGLELQAEATLDSALKVLDRLDGQWLGERLNERPAPPKRCRTLVVEDDSNERELLAGLLAMHGCECQTAADGLDALDYLASHERPDVVLLDLLLPRCNGAETLARIRGNPQLAGLKVFAVSGTSPQALGIGTGPGGFDAWFPKPLDPRKLWEAIQQNVMPQAN